MEFLKPEKTEEINRLMDIFRKNSDKMLEELKKGSEIVIKKNKNDFVFYSNLVKRIK